MDEFFIADLHFGHDKMLEYGRHFATVEDMDEALIAAWNSVVRPDDLVRVLGDFSFYPPEVSLGIFNRLHGLKDLLPGNHDKPKRMQLPWRQVLEPIVYLRTQKRRLVLSHYPMLVWQNCQYGSWHLHGHSHGNLRAPLTTRLDVGADALPGMRPISLGEIVTIMKSRTFVPVDHHD